MVAAWRSLKSAGSMPLGNTTTAKSSRQLWPGTSKQASLTQPLKSDLDLGYTWTSPSSSTPEYLKEALGMKKPKHSRSASNGHIPGTPMYKEKEDMYDEIIELKKMLHSEKNNVDMVKTKLRRLEEENNRKDRQIEQLLDPSRGSEFARTLAEKRSETSWVINGLKQRILKLEQQCKEKDNVINKLQTDVKTTNLEEMRITLETYHEEIRRLRILLANSEAAGRRSSPEKSTTQKQQKTMKAAVMHLARNVRELQDENQSLKEDLDKVLSNSPISSKAKGYRDWSKQRLVRRISELEKKVGEQENTRLQSVFRATSAPLVQSTPTTARPEQRGPEPFEEGQRLRGLVKKLKGERKALQTQLAEKNLEIKMLLEAKAVMEKELKKENKTEKERRNEESLRDEAQSLTMKMPELKESRTVADDSMERALETWNRRVPQVQEEFTKEGPAENSSDLPSLPTSECSEEENEDPRRDKAARILQAHWKAYRSKKKEVELDEAAEVLQAAFRGHLVRQRLLSNNTLVPKSPTVCGLPNKGSCTSHGYSSSSLAAACTENEEAVIVIQSIFRAHLARTGQRPSVSSHASERISSVNSSKEKASAPVYLKPSSSTFTTASPGKEDSKLRGEEIVKESAAEEKKIRPTKVKPPSVQSFSTVSLHSRLQPVASPPVDEVHSDDSDDIIISPHLPMKKKHPHS
ncbi:IQ domain-containing protein E isoform X2 [Tachyglossus aculeatus]|uniref:IQ domain-containing protein E isoform X2 n=1 Tax=Tachyglossus aculeatus TaxID=9261 RepID=UPI0018F6427B|nr:IQ domain-containing protein E isoform X2 [Tachyglossus aculeatus]